MVFVSIAAVVCIRATIDCHVDKIILHTTMRMTDRCVVVGRDRSHIEMPISDLSSGNTIFLKRGDFVPTTGSFLSGYSLKIAVPNDTLEQAYTVDMPYQYMACGSRVILGSGYMLVISLENKNSKGCDDFDEKTPLQSKLEKLTMQIRIGVVVIAFAITLVNFVHWVVGSEKKTKVIRSLLKIFSPVIYIPLMVAPEGWPIIVTLSFAFLKGQLMENRACFRSLAHLEALGTIDTVCTQTNILRSKKMKVTVFCVGEEIIVDNSVLAPNTLSLLNQAVSLNLTSSLYNPSSSSPRQIFDSPAAMAILEWGFSKLKLDIVELKKRFTVLHHEPFDAFKKRSGVLVMEDKDSTTMHWKGAPELILSLCSHYYTRAGISKVIDVQTRRRLEKLIQHMAAESLHCLAYAFKRTRTQTADHLTLLALLGLEDPCQKGVKEVVDGCRAAGIEIKMISGDHPLTGNAISTECGILKEENVPDAFTEGRKFRRLSKEEKMNVVNKICVMTRSSPADKTLMVDCLKDNGRTVAAFRKDADSIQTLKKADVAISMCTGTEAAKMQSGIIILDDNFNTFEVLIKCGRCIHYNTGNYIQFQ